MVDGAFAVQPSRDLESAHILRSYATAAASMLSISISESHSALSKVKNLSI